jgi:hypothetical protein
LQSKISREGSLFWLALPQISSLENFSVFAQLCACRIAQATS